MVNARPGFSVLLKLREHVVRFVEFLPGFIEELVSVKLKGLLPQLSSPRVNQITHFLLSLRVAGRLLSFMPSLNGRLNKLNVVLSEARGRLLPCCCEKGVLPDGVEREESCRSFSVHSAAWLSGQLAFVNSCDAAFDCRTEQPAPSSICSRLL